MELVLIPTVIAVVELLRRLQARDWFASLTIVAAGLIGLLFGALHAPGVVDAWSGLVGGLAASGVVTALTRINTSSSVGDRVTK
jgi:membrane protease YdiL (CAAX protease family)